MRIATAFIAIGFVIMMLGGIMWALGHFRGAEFDEPHIITTDAGVTSCTFILANKVVDDATVNITVVSSNLNDAPIPFTYTKTNRQLVINGLHESDTRTLTVSYLVPRLDDFIDLIARYFPAFLILGAICAIVGVVTMEIRHR